MALTSARNTKRLGAAEVVLSELTLPQIASSKIYNGAIVVVNGGYADKGQAALGLIAAGRAALVPQLDSSDNTAGNNGDKIIRVEQGVFPYLMGSTVDAIAQANVGQPCYIIDDQTVGLTDGGGVRSRAGVIVGIKSSTEVYVYMALQEADSYLQTLPPEEVSASGALSVLRRTTRLTISGTKAYTLADGTRPGQRKTLFVVAASATPVGVVTPAHASGFTTITFGASTALSAVELEWDSSLGTPAWKVVGVAQTAGSTLTIA